MEPGKTARKENNIEERTVFFRDYCNQSEARK